MSKPIAVETEQKLAFCDHDVPPASAHVLAEESFRRMLCRERKRAERSRRNFILMLVNSKSADPRTTGILPRTANLLSRAVRDTDLVGWFEDRAVVGVLFCELGPSEIAAAVKAVESKMLGVLRGAISEDALSNLEITFHTFPEHFDKAARNPGSNSALYPDLLEMSDRKKLSLLMKRVIDVAGSFLALLFLLPVFVVLAVIIKLTSPGPVFFRQQRVGRFQVPFVFLKFRSMHVSTDATIHQEYVRNFIAGKAEMHSCGDTEKRVYKITNDPRVTWIGKFMRRTSLDEIPQFWNVLIGEMSLVGPRPPIVYEIDNYDAWHRRRFLEVKPGITGLWQVRGRSRTTFDDMVRLDLQYARTWSPATDLKILWQTPRAVFSGDGAY